MNDLERLVAIEDIKRLKSRYFYCIDHQDWPRWTTEVLADDCALHVPGLTSEPVVGGQAIVEWILSRPQGDEDLVSTHYGHMPDIEIHSDTKASGVWAMEDILRLPEHKRAKFGWTLLHGYGHYHETYVKRSEGWRIQSTKLTRLHVDRS